MVKIRLDQLLVDRGLARSRAHARSLILSGVVLVNDERRDKAGDRILEDASVRLKREAGRFASRGGDKLEAALEAFGISVKDRAALDVGASTGGFTDCLLQRGARRVIAVDVGYGQIAWKLRNDPRVAVLDRCNIRHLERDRLVEAPDMATIDVSFISLEKVLPKVRELLADPCEVVALVKPQFEVGREGVGKGGVVRDPAKHRAARDKIENLAPGIGYKVLGWVESPLRGAKGNREFFIHLTSCKTTVSVGGFAGC